MIDIFKAFLLTSAIGTALAIILTLFKPITRKLFSGSWHYYIWLVVLLVMIFPIKLTLPQASEVLPKTEIVNTHLEKSEEAQAPTTNTPLTIVENTQPIQTEQSTQPKTASVIEKAINYMNSFSIVFSYIWIIVAVSLLLFRLFNYFIFILRLHKYTEVISCPEVAEYTNRKITTRVSEKISAPLIIGIFRPTLLLPKTSLTQEQLHNILSHEITHLNRNDLLYKWFVSLVKCLCWYNPMIYFISRQINIDCEISCDLTVVEKMNDMEKKSYIETILLLLTHNKSKVVPLTTGMAGNKKILKRRFAMIKKPFKISKKTMIISIVLAVVILGASVLASGILNGKLFNIYKNETIELNTDKRNGDIFNTLLLGVDEKGRADTIMLVMLTDNDLTGLSIPRDTYFNGKRISDILTEENGDQKVVDTVRNEFSIPITYYAKVKIDIIKDLVDNTGGLPFDIPMDMKYDDPYKGLTIDLAEGEKILNGEGVSGLLCYRKSNDGKGYANGDLGRIEIGQQVITKFLQDNMAIDIIGNSKKVVDSINENIVTNYSLKNYLNDKDIWINKKISFFTVPGSTVFSKDGMYVYEIDYGRLKNLLSYDMAVQNNNCVNDTFENTIKNFFGHFAKSEFEAMKSYCTKKFVANEFYKDSVHSMKRATLDKLIAPLEKDITGDNLIIEVYVTIPAEKPQKQGEYIQTNLNISLIKQADGTYLIDDFVL